MVFALDHQTKLKSLFANDSLTFSYRLVDVLICMHLSPPTPLTGSFFKHCHELYYLGRNDWRWSWQNWITIARSLAWAMGSFPFKASSASRSLDTIATLSSNDVDDGNGEAEDLHMKMIGKMIMMMATILTLMMIIKRIMVITILRELSIDDRHLTYIQKKISTITIRSTYYIFCRRGQDWTNPELLAT